MSSPIITYVMFELPFGSSHLFDLPTPSFWLHFHDPNLHYDGCLKWHAAHQALGYASKSRWKIMLMSKLQYPSLDYTFMSALLKWWLTSSPIIYGWYHLVLLFENMIFWWSLNPNFCRSNAPCVLVKPHGYSGDVNRTSAVIHSYHSRDSAHQIGFTSTFTQDELLRPCWPISWKNCVLVMVSRGNNPKMIWDCQYLLDFIGKYIHLS